MNTKRLFLRIIWFTLLLIAACRREDTSVQPTSAPPVQPTPRSTPLPALATAISPGQADNPMRMVIRPDGSKQVAQGAVKDFEAAILNQSGLVVQVQLVDKVGEAVAALCNSSGGNIVMAWLSGLGYTAAEAQNCGQPVLQVLRGTRNDTSSGGAASIIIKKGAKINGLADLKGKVFCRIGYQDAYSWLIPSLMLTARQIDPYSLKAVNDYSDIPKLVAAVASGDCDAAGIPATGLDQFSGELGGTRDEVDILETSIEIPYAILMIPPDVPLGTRLTLTDTLVKLAASSQTAVKMRPLLGQNSLVATSADDFTDFADFMSSTGLNFAQLGN